MLSQTVEKLGTGVYRYTYSGTSPYRVYRDGVLWTTTNDATLVLQSEDDEEPIALEILDSLETDDPLSITNPPILKIVWRGNEDTQYYLIEQYVAAVWTEVGRIIECGDGYYVWTSQALSDLSTEQFRVKAINARGVTSLAITHSTFVVRNPETPMIDATYTSSSNTLIVSARA